MGHPNHSSLDFPLSETQNQTNTLPMQNLLQTIQLIFRENPLAFSLVFSFIVFLNVLLVAEVHRFIFEKRRAAHYQALIREMKEQERRERNRL